MCLIWKGDSGDWLMFSEWIEKIFHRMNVGIWEEESSKCWILEKFLNERWLSDFFDNFWVQIRFLNADELKYLWKLGTSMQQSF